MTDRCGCCVGVQAVTPAPVANRPGLDALAYRVGTHGRFLETMLARLSGHLSALNTRSPEDPAIALLDAWAAVADVLTFYQERIVNEGFLRTATERRSVVDLGRLVGYRLQPGAAATTYLSYELEPGAQVRLEAGSQVQSVPGPGELPQTFETVEDLDARGEWNLLQVRQTRAADPAALAALSAGDSQTLYLKGITTGLNPNDPLLADFGARQQLYRVVEVTPDGTADRTRVTVRPWQATSARRAPTPPALAPTAAPTARPSFARAEPTLADRVSDLVARYTDLAAAGVRRTSVIAGRVVQLLERLRTNVMLGMDGTELAQFLADQVLPTVRTEQALALRGRSAPLQAWLHHLADDFGEVTARTGPAEQQAADAPADTTAGPAPAFAATAAPSAAEVGSTTTIGDIVDSLAQPPSVPPANALRLARNTGDTFGGASDVLPALLTAMRPELAATLYAAWHNVPATPPSPLRVYALRLRAAPFGHNAPPELVTNSDGIVVGSREWTLQKASGDRVPESFEVAVVLPIAVLTGAVRGGAAQVTVHIRDVSREVTVPIQDLLDGPLTIDLPQADEQVVVTLALSGSPLPAADALRVVFVRRALAFQTTLDFAARRRLDDDQARVTWSSEGSDPTAVRLTLTRLEPGSPIEGHAAGVPVVRTVISGRNRVPAGMVPTEQPDVVSLDATYPNLVPDGWIVVERPDDDGSPPDGSLVIRRVRGVRDASRDDYGLVGRSTFVQLDGPWLQLGPDGDTFAVIRGSTVFGQSQPLELVETPLDPVTEPLCGAEIPLDGLYDGLRPGRWLIVSGERTDVGGATGAAGQTDVAVPGVPATELVMLAGVRQEHDPAEPGAVTRTTVSLATDLAYCYQRDTVRVYGNVVKATHGKTNREVLGSGDGSKPNQAFQLRQKPLTFVPAVTPTGVESTLAVYVDDLRWHEAETPIGLTPTDRSYITATDDDETTTVVFGNGSEGSRLPTGAENVSTVYRAGLGQVGNVRAGQLNLLATRPQGVTGVSNPLPAAGGTDREDRDQARRNIPLAVTALDRIVSVQDYADFARTFAGIGKASAVTITDGRRETVHLTIAGIDDIPLIPSDLYQNLRAALREFGDPLQPLQIAERRLRLLVIAANVRVDPDHRWETVAPAVRTALLDRFAFAQRDLGQDVTRSEVLNAIQHIDGVTYVDLDILDTIDEDQVRQELTQAGSGGLGTQLGLHQRLRASLAAVVPGPVRHIAPAELIYLTPAVPDTLILEVVE